VLCTPGVWARHRRLALTAPAMVVRGVVQNATGAVTVVADRLTKLDMGELRIRGLPVNDVASKMSPRGEVSQ
jgi:hypothetical protein